ncbi:MAG: hypothetical protein Q9192_000867 [Flavoplaca navasiana]
MDPSVKPATSGWKHVEPVIHEWTVVDRHYEVRASTFTKRQLRPQETTLNRFGQVSEYAFNKERLENERDALILISQTTTIPVPRYFGWSVDDDGVASLVVEKLEGRMLDWLLDDGMDDVKLTDEEKLILRRNVDAFIQNTVLPQLGNLRSKTMGQLGGVLFAPPGISQAPARFTKAPPAPRPATTERYVYCHNDLAQHNIVIKPDSLEVLCLIDWEFSGFFPPGFEVPFWRYQRVEGEWTHENGGLVDFESRRAMLKEPVDETVDPKAPASQLFSYGPWSRFFEDIRPHLPILLFLHRVWSLVSNTGPSKPSH